MISAYTYLRNVSLLDYPFVESITSVLPICDEFIIAVGDCTDDTLEKITEISSPKIKIIHTVWEKDNLKDGKEFSRQASIALAQCKHDWVLHIQCDEVLHEDEILEIKKLTETFNSNLKVEGFLFDYLHFYGSYTYICKSPRWYRREIRLFRNRIGVQPYRDSQGFRIENRKLNVIKTNFHVYHYSRVNNPETVAKKIMAFDAQYGRNTDFEEQKKTLQNDGELLSWFEKKHPDVMQSRIKNANWNFEYEPKKVKIPFKYAFKLWVEKYTGYLPFEYKNYRIIGVVT